MKDKNILIFKHFPYLSLSYISEDSFILMRKDRDKPHNPLKITEVAWFYSYQLKLIECLSNDKF